MKKKVSISALNLNKKKITKLNHQETQSIKGGSANLDGGDAFLIQYT